MATSILATKLFRPPLRPKITLRPRLIQQLNNGLHRKLTLVSAQAGFGKSTLISQWLDTCDRPSGWLTLDERDSSLPQFLAYVIAALQGISAELLPNTTASLDASQPPRPDEIVTTLLNDLAAADTAFILVLDDYHRCANLSIDETVSFLVEHLPPQMHLVIITREDPQLPLARLRARGQMTELRVGDLRFADSEAAGFLNQVMGLTLSAENIAALGTRTEGWIAGLQLAALSLQGQSDTTAFINAFTGSHAYILDYLVEEVLQNQPAHIRSFLLKTSILGRLCDTLCDTVTGEANSKEILGALERGNLFVVPLDGQREWYRYHHLFADVLQAHLAAEQDEDITALHGRASIWHEQQGLQAEAIEHAFAANDLLRAASLTEAAWRGMDQQMQLTSWLQWAQALPDEMIRMRPVLSLGYAWALFETDQLTGAEERLRDAEAGFAKGVDSAEIYIADTQEFHTLPASVASARAYIAQAHGDMAGTVRYAQQAIDLTPHDNYLGRAIPFALIGLTHWASGSFADAHEALTESMAAFIKDGNLLLGISATFALADMQIVQGQLNNAEAIYREALALVTGQDGPPVQGTAGLLLGLSELSRERGELAAAKQYLQQCKALNDLGDRVFQYRWRIARAVHKQHAGEFEAAYGLLDDAKAIIGQLHLPDVQPIEATKARVAIAQGDLVKAAVWQREAGVAADDALTFLREYEHVTLARLLIARFEQVGDEGALDDVAGFLGRLLISAETNARFGSAIEISLLQAITCHHKQNQPQALAALNKAITLAQPSGHIRLFVREGQPVENLLKQQFEVADPSTHAYIKNLIHAFPAQKQAPVLVQPSELVDPLSTRELDVLKLLGSDLSGPQIADALSVSLNTLRTHTKNIYSKLHVNSRRAAVSRGTDLGLL